MAQHLEKAPRPDPTKGGAGAPDKIEVTDQMIEAGLKVLYASGIVDGPSGEDSELVAEIFDAMLHF
jgi:hypothetical protein